MGFDARTSDNHLLGGARKHRRDTATVDKNAEAAKKIVAFFGTIPGLTIIPGTCAYVDHNKINLLHDEATLTIQHRSTSIQVVGRDLAGVEAAFRQWVAKDMNHAKVFPRSCPKRSN